MEAENTYIVFHDAFELQNMGNSKKRKIVPTDASKLVQ